MRVTFKSRLFKKEGNVWDVAIYVPKKYAELFIDKKDKRVLCTINGDFTFHAGLMPQGNGDSFINTNSEIRKKLKLEVDDTVEVTLEKDTSEYGMPLPNELKTAWEMDEHAHHLFHQLTMGKQRNLIHLVGKLKSSEKRIEKSLVILEYLKSVNGKLDFKELNQAFKDANKK